MGREAERDFREWASARRAWLRRTAFLLCGDWHLADDVVQEALTRLFSVWPRVVASGEPEGYARKMLVNLCIDQRRRPWRRELSCAALPSDGRELSPAADGHLSSRTHLVDALRNLPAGQRAVIALRYAEDLSIAETAQLLGTSEGNVKSQASRGLVALRRALAGPGGSSAVGQAKESS